MKRTKTIQKLIVEVIQKWIVDADKMMGEEYVAKYGSEAKNIMYNFHDDSSIATDGTLYDILVHGQSDYGYGSELHEAVNKVVEDNGYYLEYDGQGMFSIVS